MVNEFKTIKDISIAEYKDRGSKFVAYATSIQNEQDALNFIKQLWKENPKACHICFAYKFGYNSFVYRLNDDGEPAYTAATPIFNYIEKYGLSNILVAVVRFFGGVLLGKGGLIKAYGSVTESALIKAEIIPLIEFTDLTISLPFEWYAKIMDFLNHHNVVILHQEFDRLCSLKINLPVHLLMNLKKDFGENIIFVD